MSKVIEVPFNNGWKCINWCRQETNKSNLREDTEVWKLITSKPDDYELVSARLDKKGRRKWKFEENVGNYKNGTVKTLVNRDATQIIQTIFNRICSNLLAHGFETEEDVTFSCIKNMANIYVQSPWQVQLEFCRNSTRQRVDEDVQAKYLNVNVNSSFKTLDNGEKVLYEGDIVTKQEANVLNEEQLDARSIDTIGKIIGANREYNVGVFQKVSKEAGSGQSQQALEVKHWLKEAIKIKDPSWIFVAQLDGPEAENHIEGLSNIVKDYSHIFVGNSESCSTYLNRYKDK